MTAIDVNASDNTSSAPPRWPHTFWLGLLIMLVCEAMLFADVAWSGRGVIRSEAEHRLVTQNTPNGTIATIARWFAVNMTAIVWIGYVIFLEGLLTKLTGASPVRRRPHHFALLCLASVFIWAVFDMINFNLGMKAWVYIGMPGAKDWTGLVINRGPAYMLAFGTVVPGMLMSGQVLMELGAFNWARTGRNRGGTESPRPAKARAGVRLWVSLLVGLGMVGWVFLARTPVTNFVLWTSLVFLLDPINYWFGRPSMFRDWERGWFGRTLAACAGGLICGFLWEFWNYWALTKWVYQLPFLGVTEQYRYFEMPLVGLLGFIPFGMECWVMWQFMRVKLDGLAEGLPGERALL